MTKNTPKQLKVGDHGAKLPTKPDKEKAVAKRFMIDDVRDLIKEIHLTCDPDFMLENATEKVNAYLAAPEKEAKEFKKDMLENHKEALNIFGLETHYPLADMVGKSYRPLVIEVARKIEKEYDCKAPSEKMLAQTIAGVYGKIIEYSRQLTACTQELMISNEKNAFYAMLSKELDRAHRQLITALVTLRQIKHPPMELNVKAKTAFVAQNQQINAVNNPIPQHENIEPK